MSRCKLRTPLPIHFKLHIVIGIDSLMVIFSLMFVQAGKMDVIFVGGFFVRFFFIDFDWYSVF